MRKQPMLAGALGVVLAAQPITQVSAAVYAEPPVARSRARLVERIQGGPHREWRRGPARTYIRVGAAAHDGVEPRPGVGLWAGLADPIGSVAPG